MSNQCMDAEFWDKQKNYVDKNNCDVNIHNSGFLGRWVKAKLGGLKYENEYDNFKNKIIVKHYYKDNQPGFIIKGHSSESILLSILKKELISQMSHAGYLGAELSKAEIALKLNLKYTQDQTLRNK